MKKIIVLITAFIISCFIIDWIFPFSVNPDYSVIVNDADKKPLTAFLNRTDKWRMKAELNEIIPDLKKVLIYKEDRWFYYHPGVNPASILRALSNNLISGRRTSGASTITMQVVRLLNPKERTYWNKIAEILRAVQLELHYSKDEILQLYLNLIPYGGNIEGVKSATLLYFDRLPEQLSLSQITALMVIPNNPTQLTPGKRNEQIKIQRDKWLDRFAEDELFPEDQIHSAKLEPFDVFRTKAPNQAPHWSLRLKNKYPDKSNINSTVIRSVQEKAENLTLNYSRRMQSKNIRNVSVVIINNKTNSVEAYIGSQDFWDSKNAGQVDGVTAVRSPGSTLKPLVYAMGLDAGLITPKTIVKDVPTDFGGFTPENYDLTFNGNLTVEKALSHSLNIPAVELLDKIGVQNLTQKLVQMQFSQIEKDRQKLGLSTVLGGCGVRLDELVGLYRMLALNGKYTTVKFTDEDSDTASTQIISEASAYLITQILTQLTRPDLPYNSQSSYRIPKIAWKTGTSYGRRDAWSVGYNKKYTIGVWLGNFDGEGVPDLTGAETATPLLFDLFNTLDYASNEQWFFPPSTISFRNVCSVSGLLPNTFCEQLVLDDFIPGVSSMKKCDHLISVSVSPNEKISYCTTCQPNTGYKVVLYPRIDPEIAAYYSIEKIAYKKIPIHNPNCTRVFSEGIPVITSPSNGKEYLLEKGESQQLMLSANVEQTVTEIFWYINNKFYKKAKAQESVFFSPPIGIVKISCSDDKGRNADIVIQVTEK